MDVVGYTTPLSARPTESIAVKVSCRLPSYDVRIVRLRHGDVHPDGPGLRVEPVSSDVDGTYPGREQDLRLGSFVVVDDERDTIALLSDFTLTAFLFPTSLGSAPSGIITQWSGDERRGFGLLLGVDGCLELHLADGDRREVVRLEPALPLSHWSFVTASFAAASSDHSGHVRLAHRGCSASRGVDAWHSTETSAGVQISNRRGPVLLAASHLVRGPGATAASGCFTGKLARPTILDGVVDASTTESLFHHGEAPGRRAVAAWDFALEMATDVVVDTSTNAINGRTLNAPLRAVTGPRWTGREIDFRAVPHEYDAIHFHDDDLDDARWDTDFTLVIPDHWPSGIYAAHLSTDDFDDYVPFVVRSAPGSTANRIALLLPTVTYMAYANEHMMGDYVTRQNPAYAAAVDVVAARGTNYEAAVFRYITDVGLNSVYDLHADFSGVAFSSRLRPMLNMRPRYNKPGLHFRYAHGLNCDLYTVDWLTEKGYEFDVVTDEDLHHEGHATLAPYQVILTGSHPEYWTWDMLTGLRDFLDDGGRLMYLGGNGFYWVGSLSPQQPHLLEVRRGVNGTRAWSSHPGETHHSSDGVKGGLWRDRGLAPQSTVGIGFSGLLARFADEPGGVNAVPYVRTPASADPRVQFIFEGVDSEVIGDFGLHFGAAAGYELDSVDEALGTPPHALVVATADASAIYLPAVELLRSLGRDLAAAKTQATRADMTFFEGPNGGAVFSVGSISWTGSLSHDGYDNSASRVMQNVLDRFADPAPFHSKMN